MKKTLLTWHDYIAPTGFGNVAKHLLKGLGDEYEVHVVAINAYDQTKNFNNKDIHKLYYTEKSDKLSFNTLIKVAKELKPDLIFLFQDIFHIDAVIKEVKTASPDSKIVSYFPIDGQPPFSQYGFIFEYSDVLITYSDWAIQVLKDFLPHKIKEKELYKLYHGVDTEVFKPLPASKVLKNRKDVGWDDKFVCINVNTFQPRKQLALSVRAFSMFALGYNECQTCGHQMPKNFKGCELCMSRDLLPLGKRKDDVVLYLHTMAHTAAMGPYPTDHLVSVILNAGFTKEDIPRVISVNNADIPGGEVPESVLNELYNAADYNISSSVGEGCGLSLLESAAVGIPSIVPKTSAIPEMLGPYGHQIMNRAVFSMRGDNGHVRPVVDEIDFREILDERYRIWKAKGRKKIFKSELVKRIKSEFSWEDKREYLHSLFKKALST